MSEQDPKSRTVTLLRGLVPKPTVHRHALARVRFLFEQLLLRGGTYRLVVVALAIGTLSLLGGVAVVTVDQSFGSFSEAVWWAFLRLTDPGYLGDDVGVGRRVVSTFMTVAGYVVFLGALVAIMTQWLNAWIERTAAGVSPIVANHHVVLLGWNNRTVAMVRELSLSTARLRRFLTRLGSRQRRLRIALLVEDATEHHYQELVEGTGPELDRWDLAIRTGTPLRLEHLYRVDAFRSAAIILAGDDNLLPSVADGETVKTLLSAAGAADAVKRLPLVVAEVFDPANVEHAVSAYPGPLEVVASDQLCARVIAQNLRHPGLSAIHVELLTYYFGNELYVREADDSQVGRPASALIGAWPRAVFLGVVRGEGADRKALLCPHPDEIIAEGDRLVLIAEEYEHTEPREAAGRLFEVPAGAHDLLPATSRGRRRVLVLGWNHRAAPLMAELLAQPGEHTEATIVSSVDIAHRERELKAYGAAGAAITHVVADYARAHDIAQLEPATFDSIVLLASDRIEADARVDARTILGVMVLQRAMADVASTPPILVEVMEAQNAPLVLERGCEVLISPVLVSQTLTMVALRRELHAVLNELLGVGGAEMCFLPARALEATGALTFAELERRARARGLIALGVRVRGHLRLNPPRTDALGLSDDDQLVVLARSDAAESGARQ